MGYAILIKRKNSKKWIGAIPVKKGVTLSTLRKTIPKSIKPAFSYRIVSTSQLRKLLLKKAKRSGAVRKIRKKLRRKRNNGF